MTQSMSAGIFFSIHIDTVQNFMDDLTSLASIVKPRYKFKNFN